ncbi:thiamine phosphate synthase [Elizabethkingia sp. JS20170427COW]|uniref:thiamine phosphate synthase n=1 Tax=Elizabethkingia sp. JS20170427COW TaxID=2583851 RepID=UPI001110A7B9|nr:thiamine phosphate synthase [Elizabethkingia sp. JS20170427COW]QCX54179.1 thiamine phosphate synthase [Elizabethkingia sp. JS20170427COW]
MKHTFPYRLYLVLSQKDCGDKNFLWVAEEAIKGGVDVIQLREKEYTYHQFIQSAQQLKAITDQYKVPLIINDNLEVQQKLSTSGLHVGVNDISPVEVRKIWNQSGFLLGYSIEKIEQINSLQADNVDYLGISPVFKTTTKTDTITEWGLEGISQIRQLTDKPLVAIGNMNKENAAKVIKAGADCIAVVSAICKSENPQQAARELKNEILKDLP